VLETMLLGWYFDVIIGYLIRTVILIVKTRRSNKWPVEKASVSSSTCPADSYGGPVAEIGYPYIHDGSYFYGIHRKPFILRGSAEEYVARFPAGTDIVVRVKPEQPETSIFCDEDQSAVKLGG
jgi:hypothetical protein